MRRVLVVGSAVLAIALVALFAMMRRTSSPGEPTATTEEAPVNPDVIVLDEATIRTIGLKVEPAASRPFADTIKTTGVVGPNETRVAHVRLLAPGRVQQVHVRVGDRVTGGQPLLTYDNVELGSLVGDYLAALAAVDRANAEEEVSRRALERAGRLIEVGGLSRAEYERREADHHRALSEETSAGTAATNIEKKLERFGMSSNDLKQLQTSPARDWSRTTIRSPFAGVVTAADVAPGDAVDTQRELFTVVDLSTVWIIGDLYQKDLAAVRTGQDALITTESYPGETFTGRVTYVSDVLDASTRTAKVRCEIQNRAGRLKLQMLVAVQLPTSTPRDALVVPALAVQDIDGESVVFVQTAQGQFQKRAVQTGTGDGHVTPIVSGLAAGEPVVTAGAFMLKGKLKAGSIAIDDEAPEKK